MQLITDTLLWGYLWDQANPGIQHSYYLGLHLGLPLGPGTPGDPSYEPYGIHHVSLWDPRGSVTSLLDRFSTI